MKKVLFISIIILILLSFCLFLFFGTRKTNQSPLSFAVPTPIPAQKQYHPLPATVVSNIAQNVLPEDVPEVAASKKEVEKLSDFLPYREDVPLQGRTVTIIIPQKALQNTPWTLTVLFAGINFQDSEEKGAFLQVANHLFSWMSTKGVDPNKLIIIWGDTAFIQQQASLWLSNQ